MNKRQLTTLSWVLIAIYATVTILRRSFAPDLLPVPISTALATFVPLIFIFVHGSLSYRLRDLLVFVAITLVVSNIFENMSVLTGFPFGHYRSSPSGMKARSVYGRDETPRFSGA